MNGAANRRMLVVGVGNPERGDDGIGPMVAANLAQRSWDGVRVLVCNGDALSLIEEWGDTEVVVLIDAAAPVSRPGYIHRMDLASQKWVRGLSRSSTHALGIPEVIDLARTLGRLPRRLIVYAVEGASFEPGAAMSADVARAADELTRLVRDELECHKGAVLSPRGPIEGAAEQCG